MQTSGTTTRPRRRRPALTATILVAAVVIAALVPASPAQAATATLTGTVTSSGGPVAAYVQLYRADAEELVLTAVAGADGTWSASVDPGTYRMRAWPGGAGLPATWYPGTAVWDEAGNIGLVDGQARVVDLDVAPAGAVSGTVRYDGVPAEGAWVAVHVNGTLARYTITAPDGTYRMGGLPPGPYDLTAWDPTRQHATRWYPNAIGVGGSQTLQVPPGGELSALDLDLPATGSIRGRVVSLSGAPLPGIVVVAAGTVGSASALAVAGADGSYAIEGLPSGAYRVRSWDPAEIHANLYLPSAPDLWGSPPVQVQGGSTTQVEDLVTDVTGQIPPPPYEGDPTSDRVAVLGDSITQVSTTTFQQQLGASWSVSVQGFHGRLAAELLPNADRYAPTSPDQVVINLGANDAHQGVPTAQTVSDLQAIVDRFPDARCIHLTTITTSSAITVTTDGAQRLNAELRAMTDADPRLRLVDWDATVAAHRESGAPNRSWSIDGIHPTTAGQEALAGLIDASLRTCDAPPGSITGLAYLDRAGDGARQADDPGQPSMLVRAWRDLDADGTFETIARQGTTDVDGGFHLTGLAADDYRITVDDEIAPPPTAPPGATPVTVTSGAVTAVDLPVASGVDRLRAGVVLDGTDLAHVRDLVAGDDGSVVVAGDFAGTLTLGSGPTTQTLTSAGGTDVFVAELDSSGEPVWAQRLGGPSTDQAWSVAIGPDGAVAVTGVLTQAGTVGDGTAAGTVAASNSAVTAVFEPTGAPRWWRSASGAALSVGTAVTFDDLGQVVTAAAFVGSMTPQGSDVVRASGAVDTVITARDPATGDLAWLTPLHARTLGAVLDLTPLGDGRLAADGFGDGAELATATGPLTLAGTGGTDILVATIDSATGTPLAGRLLGSTGSDAGARAAVDPVTGDLYLAGALGAPTVLDGIAVDASADAMVLSLADDLSVRWVQVIASPGDGVLADVAVDGDRVRAVGAFDAPMQAGDVALVPAHSDDGLLVELSTGGVVVGAASLAGATGNDALIAIDHDPWGTVVLGGWFHGAARMGVGGSALTVVGDGSEDALVATLAGA